MSTIIEQQVPATERVAPDHEVAIIGAGFGGIGAGIALQRQGIHDFVILDKWDQVGAAMKCLYLVTRFLNPTGADRAR
ncbi:MAG: NAD(P)-binding domain-containing protein [Mycobacterium sp.]